MPRIPTVIMMGARNCIDDTPRLPRPALRPSADPLRSFGKKKLMLAIDEEKLPPPKPQRSARTRKVVYDVVGSCTHTPMPMAGISSDAVEIAVQRRPPKIGTMNE